jgi:SAM-dependent methyltransferase
MSYNPASPFVGGFLPNDGTIDFYLRVNSLARKSHTLLDLGAGRAEWYEDEQCETRKSIRLMTGKVATVVAADVDDAVLFNRASDKQIIMKDGVIPLGDSSVDLVVADYVLEHVEEPEKFAAEVSRVLKAGGWFCARTPHYWNYVSVAARLIRNSMHSKVLSQVQPGRKSIDVFPTSYKLNKVKSIREQFPGFDDQSFVFRASPSYFAGSRLAYTFLASIHRFMPPQCCGNIFAFLRKRENVQVVRCGP